MSKPIDYAMNLAREYREGARSGILNQIQLDQIEVNIAEFVGRWENGAMVIPQAVADAMGLESTVVWKARKS